MSKQLFKTMREMSCLVCGRIPTEVCHVKSKGSGGADEPYNLMSLCRTHHSAQHVAGLITFIEKHPSVKSDLVSKGWTFEDVNGKTYMTHPEVQG